METKLEVGKCKNCKKYWKKNQLKQFTYLLPVGDGIVKKIDFLCGNCFDKLEKGLNNQKDKKEAIVEWEKKR